METVEAKTILSAYREDGWFTANYNMNLYRGCCHGCIYCDSRSDCYGIKDFDTVRAKRDALGVLERELASKRRKGVVTSGSMSDSYNPAEREEKLTRGALELFAKHGYGVGITTKSALASRDIDVLQEISRFRAAAVSFTVTAADDVLCGKIERNVSVTSERFAAMREISRARVLTGVTLMPVLPFITDSPENIARIAETAAECGAKWVYPGFGFGVTLRENQRAYFLNRLDESFPGLRKSYTDTFGSAYHCASPRNGELWGALTAACEKYGLMWDMGKINAWIRRETEPEQMKLF